MVEGSGATLTVGTAPLPTELQGMFWLTEQGDSSALMTFAQSNDGDGISTGEVGTATNSAGATIGTYRVRVGGDRSWSFHDRSTNWRLAHWLDLIYNFEFEYASDGSGRIVAAQIKPEAGNLFGFTLPPWLLSFRATMAEHPRYKNSLVFRRDSYIAGSEIDSAQYDLVQVIDGNGNKLQPAFSDWLSYCESDETGASPGTFYYNTAA